MMEFEEHPCFDFRSIVVPTPAEFWNTIEGGQSVVVGNTTAMKTPEREYAEAPVTEGMIHPAQLGYIP